MASLPVSIPARQCPFNYCITLPPNHPASILIEPESEHSLSLLADFLVFHHLGSCVIDLFVHIDLEQIGLRYICSTNKTFRRAYISF